MSSLCCERMCYATTPTLHTHCRTKPEHIVTLMRPCPLSYHWSLTLTPPLTHASRVSDHRGSMFLKVPQLTGDGGGAEEVAGQTVRVCFPVMESHRTMRIHNQGVLLSEREKRCSEVWRRANVVQTPPPSVCPAKKILRLETLSPHRIYTVRQRLPN